MPVPLRSPEHYKYNRHRSSGARRVWVHVGGFLAAAAIVVIGVLWPQHIATIQGPLPAQKIENSVYYPNCTAARAANSAPMHVGQPGYRPELDADSDGVACEPYLR
jgi:hypothetical protein